MFPRTLDKVAIGVKAAIAARQCQIRFRGYGDALLNPHMLSDEPLAWRVVFGNPDRLRDSATSIND